MVSVCLSFLLKGSFSFASCLPYVLGIYILGLILCGVLSMQLCTGPLSLVEMLVFYGERDEVIVFRLFFV